MGSHRGPPPQPEADGAPMRRPPIRAAAASIAGHAAAASAGYMLACVSTRRVKLRCPVDQEVYTVQTAAAVTQQSGALAANPALLRQRLCGHSGRVIDVGCPC